MCPIAPGGHIDDSTKHHASWASWKSSRVLDEKMKRICKVTHESKQFECNWGATLPQAGDERA